MAFTQSKLPINTSNIADKVLNLREHWIRRDPNHPFYTLGRCVYLDGKTPEYAAEIPTTNELLLFTFGDVYAAISTYFEKMLGEEVVLNSTLAYPSFHIVAADPFFLTHGGIWHEDYPHKTRELGDKDPLSFTVAIELPTGGGGLDYKEGDKQNHVEYEEGTIVVHDGAITHRIANFTECIMGEYRITLQGHLIRHNGVMTMFW